MYDRKAGDVGPGLGSHTLTVSTESKIFSLADECRGSDGIMVLFQYKNKKDV